MDVTPDIHNCSAAFSVRSSSKVNGNKSDCNLTRNALSLANGLLGKPIKVDKSNSSYPPESHKFQAHLPLSSHKDQGLQRELPTTGIHSVMADSQVAKRNKCFALISKQSTILPPHLQATVKLLGFDQLNNSVKNT
jgi:hypothetical protein